MADTLRSRGHQPVFFGVPMNAERVREQGFEFHPIEVGHLASRTLEQLTHEMSTAEQGEALRLLGRFEELRFESILEKGPGLVAACRLDAMVVDQAEACSGSLAELHGLPWVSLCNGIALNSEPGIPPFLTSWNYSEMWPALIRNRIAYFGMDLASARTKRLINKYRKRWGLKLYGNLSHSFSPFAQISQQVREFDFPRRELPPTFHYVGPIRRHSSLNVSFPWSRLDGRRLLYASLGTVLNRNPKVYRTILNACSRIDAQLVLSLGGADDVDLSGDVSANAVVVNFAPQVELMRKAAVSIIHGGQNSTLESLSEGVPVVVIPLAFDQPGIAARVRWSGVGEFVPSSELETHRLLEAIQRVLREPSYREAARKVGSALKNAGGGEEAGRIIETVMQTGKPVLASSVSASFPSGRDRR